MRASRGAPGECCCSYVALPIVCTLAVASELLAREDERQSLPDDDEVEASRERLLPRCCEAVTAAVSVSCTLTVDVGLTWWL